MVSGSHDLNISTGKFHAMHHMHHRAQFRSMSRQRPQEPVESQKKNSFFLNSHFEMLPSEIHTYAASVATVRRHVSLNLIAMNWVKVGHLNYALYDRLLSASKVM